MSHNKIHCPDSVVKDRYLFCLKVAPQGPRSRPSSRSRRFTTTFQSFRARCPADRRRRRPTRSLTPTLTSSTIRSRSRTLSPTGSTPRRRWHRTARPQGRGRSCPVQTTLRTTRTRKMTRLPLPNGRELNLYLRPIRNMLKVSSRRERQLYYLTILQSSCESLYCLRVNSVPTLVLCFGWSVSTTLPVLCWNILNFKWH